jgi:hypothetical protein
MAQSILKEKRNSESIFVNIGGICAIASLRKFMTIRFVDT